MPTGTRVPTTKGGRGERERLGTRYFISRKNTSPLTKRIFLRKLSVGISFFALIHLC